MIPSTSFITPVCLEFGFFNALSVIRLRRPGLLGEKTYEKASLLRGTCCLIAC
jgi:hypothetical protein